MKKIKNILVIIFLFICTNGYSQLPVRDLVIHHVDSVDSEIQSIIKQVMPFKGDSLTILNHVSEIISAIKSLGYYSVSVDAVSFDSTGVGIHLFVGKKYHIKKVKITGTDVQPEKIVQKKNKRKEFLSVDELNATKNQLISYYENIGYPFARIITDNIQINDSLIDIELIVNKGNYIIFGTIFSKGDAKIKPYYINRYIDIKSGDRFSQSKINQIESRIKNLAFLEQIKPPELEFRDNEVDLYLYIKNRKANRFDGMIGFLPASDKSDKLVITGDLSLGLVNSFGRGEEIGLRWEKLESSTQKLDVDLHYPYLFKSLFGLDMNFNLYKQDSSFLNLNYIAGVRWYASPKNYIGVFYNYKSSSVIDGAINASRFADMSSSVFGATFNYMALDYKLNPRKGIDLSVSGAAGTKEVKTYYLSDADNKENYTSLEAGLIFDGFFPVYGNIVFHFGHVTRYAGQFDGKDNQLTFFENQITRFGGARSLRGFDENMFAASIYSLQNVELRYLFEQNSAFYVFWNGSYYYQPLPEKTTEDFPWGVGIGLNFDTRAGIFSLSYALGKQFDNPLEIRTAKIHFGYISRF